MGYIGLCHLRLWGHCTAGRGTWHQCKIPPQVVGVHLCHRLPWGRCTGKARTPVPPPSLGTLYREGANVCATPFPGDSVQGRRERLCHPLPWGLCTWRGRPASRGSSAQIAETRRSIVLALFSWCCSLLYLG